MYFREVDYQIDEKAFQEEVTYILSHRFIPRDWLQISLQTINEDGKPEDDWDVTIGRLSKHDHKEPDVRYLLWDTPAINEMISRFGFYRCRLVKSPPKTSLTWHYDLSDRFHVPLVTNLGCNMVIEDQCFHLPAFKLFWTNTKRMHTSYNVSSEWRTHILGCVTPAFSSLYDSSLP